METFAARLASFEAALSAPKRRASNAKGHKSITWPHQRPSPTDLAHAGFYYNPSASSQDNTACFMCKRALDGWEEEDDPIVEHLKHSSECGWAILLNASKDDADPSQIDDATGERMSYARKATFDSRWPHESKRGWMCKTDKMVEAGWYFAPTPESDDFVSCAYCKLSLDGWEPKDNPFEEHHRRSPECLFFTFAGTTAPKSSRSKKGRPSKASRLSVQSNATITSIPDLDESIDTSTMSQDTVLSTLSNMTGKKGGKAKGKTSRRKVAESVETSDAQEEPSQMKLDEDTTKQKRGKKRTSEQISEDDRGDRESTVKPEPPSKRRATRTRSSNAQEMNYPILSNTAETVDVDTPAIKSVPGGRKRASSRARKVSTASVASLRGPIPDDATLEAALAAELDKPMSDEEAVDIALVVQQAKPKSKSKAKKADPSTASTKSTKHAKLESEAPAEGLLDNALPLSEDIETDLAAETKKVAPKAKSGKGKSAQKRVRSTRVSNESLLIDSAAAETMLESSALTAHTMETDSGHETDASTTGKKAVTRKGSKRKATTRTKGKKAATTKHIEAILQSHPKTEAIIALAAVAEPDPSLIVIEKDQAALVAEDEPHQLKEKRKGGKSKAPKNTKAKAQQQSMPGMFSPLVADPDPSFNSVLAPSSPLLAVATGSFARASGLSDMAMARPSPKIPPRSPLRAGGTPQTVGGGGTPVKNVMGNATPSPSPQSSDAENQPPSSRPASERPPLATISPSRTQIQRVQLAPGTPRRVPLSPSKIGGLRSEIPWSAIDVEMIFAPSPGKENQNIFADGAKGGLRSPEKGLSVEEWIKLQAQIAEDTLKAEAERLVSVFEREGGRALNVLEGVETSD